MPPKEEHVTQHFSLPTTIVALVFAAAPIYAAGSPQQKCQAAKNQAAGKYAACRQNAEKGLALGTDSVTYDAALAKCATKLASAWTKAETKASAAGVTCVDAPLMMSDYLPILAADSDNIAAALGGAALRDCDSDLAACQASRISCTTDLATCQSGTATTADVLAGKTFSSHVGSAIGGTITNHGPANFTPSSSPQTIAAGYYGGGQVNGDANLVAGNIVAGVDLFGVTGSLIAASGNAIAAQVRSGATFSNATSSGIAGTMPDVGQQDIIPGPAPITILQGYHDGSGMVAGDTDLLAGNIRAGVELFGVTGTVTAAAGDATDDDVLEGRTYSADGGIGSGTMPNNGGVTLTPTSTDQTIAAGYHNGAGVCAGDSDLVAGNIVVGVNLFGIDGTQLPARIFKTGQTSCYDNSGTAVACAGTYQDGEAQAGLTQQFVDNGDGTISDTTSGLMWEKLSSDGSIHDVGRGYSWSGLFTRMATLNSSLFAGYSDWRVPTIHELQSLASYGVGSPAIPAIFRTACVSGCTVTTCSCTAASISSERYWSSTRSVTMSFQMGVVDRDSTTHRARAVRGGL